MQPVTEGICDSGQNVSLPYSQTGRNSEISYFQIFFLITFIHEDSIRNTIPIQRSIQTIIIIICINYNINAKNNNKFYCPNTIFSLKNFHGHTIDILRNIHTIWSRALVKFRKPCRGQYPKHKTTRSILQLDAFNTSLSRHKVRLHLKFPTSPFKPIDRPLLYR